MTRRPYQAQTAGQWEKEAPMSECQACAGCGKVVDDEDRTPWKYWMELPLQSSVAVLAGFVKPLPCPACNGTGQVHT
jgi:RecJ-like exonuclease